MLLSVAAMACRDQIVWLGVSTRNDWHEVVDHEPDR
jgi:hypothetical protein